MRKVSLFLAVSGFVALGFAAWSFVTFPIIKFSTESIVRGRLNELIDRSQLNAEELESLDLMMEFLVGNDRQWQSSHEMLHRISWGGFMLCAVGFFCGAYLARRLERKIAALTAA